MRDTVVISIFIASPSDTKDDRKLITKLIKEWNSTFGDEQNIILKVVKWENDLAIRSDIKAQNAINEDLLCISDILIGIFWTKFGSPTDNAESGTEEEILAFLKENKPVIMYFNNKPICPSDVNTKELDKIKKFKESYREDHIYRTTDLKSELKFRTLFMKDINRNIKLLDFNSTSLPSASEAQEKKWYKKSIKSLIEENLSKYGLPLPYRRVITFDENVNLWNSSVDVNHRDVSNNISRAREEAFNTKYGEYNYTLDLREKYKDSWFLIIQNLLKGSFQNDATVDIVGIASNMGIELKEIFNNQEKVNLTVFDISEKAISKGKEIYPDIRFYRENMEHSTFEKEKFDVYLNLRSIHSSGVDIRMTLAECYRLLKPNGIAIISVSNGYLTPNPIRGNELVETNGMYDNRIGTFSTDKPFDLSNKIRMKLDNYGFHSVEIHTGSTEIFIKAVK